MVDILKVAGVTFKNPDGISRQAILKAFGVGYHNAKLRQTVYDGERAVEVKINGLLIGYVKKSQLNNPLSQEHELTAYIGCINNKYYSELTRRERPTPAEYRAMQAEVYRRKTAMPAYDRRAYKIYYYNISQMPFAEVAVNAVNA